MGTSVGQGVSEAPSKMRAFIFVILAAAAMADSKPKADADAYTIGQVAYGLPLHNAIATGHAHNPGVITGVGYGGYGGYGLYGGYYGKREADSDSDAYTIGQVAHGAAYGVVTGVDYGHGLVSGYGAIGNRGYLGYGGLYGGYYGKREADSKPKADADADAYTIGQVAYGLPLHNAYATGHAHNPGVITGVGYSGYGFPFYG